MSDRSVAGIINNLQQFLRHDLSNENLSQSCERRRQATIADFEELKNILSQLWCEATDEDLSEFDEDDSNVYPTFSPDPQPRTGQEGRREGITYLQPRREQIPSKPTQSGAPRPNPTSMISNLSEELYMNVIDKNGERSPSYMSMDGPTRSILKPNSTQKNNGPVVEQMEKNVIEYSGELMYCSDATNSAHSAAWKRLRSCAIISGSLHCLKSASSNAPVVTLSLKECIITRPSGCAQRHVFRIASRNNNNVALLATTSRDSLHTWLQQLMASGAEVQLVGNDRSDGSTVAIDGDGLHRSVSSGLGPAPTLGGFKLKKSILGIFTSRRKDNNTGQSTVSGTMTRDESAGVRLAGRLFVCVLPNIDYDEHPCRLFVDSRFEVLDADVSAGGGSTPVWKETLADGAFELRVLLDCGTVRKGGAMIALRPAGKREDAIVLQADDKNAETTWITQLRLATSRLPPASQIKPETLPRDIMELNVTRGAPIEHSAQSEDLYDSLSENPRILKTSIFPKGIRSDNKNKTPKPDPVDSERRPELPPRPADLFPSAAGSSPVPSPANSEQHIPGPSGPLDQPGPRRQVATVSPPSTPVNAPGEPAANVVRAQLRPKPEEAPCPTKRLSRAGTALTGFEIVKHRLDGVQTSLREKNILLASSRAELVQLRKRDATLTEQEVINRSELQKLISTLQAEVNQLRADESELLNELKKAVVYVALRPIARRPGNSEQQPNPND